ncbi:MAG: DUF6011 domain-containing protein, partial [Pyrinomonadaceae bacterium]
ATRVVGLGRIEWNIDENLLKTIEEQKSEFDDRVFIQPAWAGKELHIIGTDNVARHEIRLQIAGAKVAPSPRPPARVPAKFPTIVNIVRETPDIAFIPASGSIVRLHHTGSQSSPSAIHVRKDGRRIGTIKSDGSVSAEPEISLDDLLELLQEFNQNPTDAFERYGRKTGACGVCDRPLTNPVSIRRGIGPICARKIAAAAALAALGAMN